MKKLLLVVWCLIVANQGLMGMDKYKEEMKKKFLEKKLDESKKEGKDTSSQEENDESEKNSSSKKEAQKIGSGNRPARISDYSDDEDEKKRALVHHKAGEEFKKKLAQDNGFNNSNNYVAYENFEQEKFFKNHKNDLAKSNGLKNYNHLIGREHAEQQFYAQQELKKIKRENRTANSIATDIQDAFWDKAIDLTAGAGAEIVVGTFIVPHLRDAALSLKGIIYPEKVKKEQEQALVQQFIQQEESVLAAKEKEAHTRTYVNTRFLQVYDANNILLAQKGLDKEKQKAFRKSRQEINDELTELVSSGKIRKKEVAQNIQKKLELLYKKYAITPEILELIDEQNRLEKDISIGTKDEIEALKNLVHFTTHVSDRKSSDYVNIGSALEQLVKTSRD